MYCTGRSKGKSNRPVCMRYHKYQVTLTFRLRQDKALGICVVFWAFFGFGQRAGDMGGEKVQLCCCWVPLPQETDRERQEETAGDRGHQASDCVSKPFRWDGHWLAELARSAISYRGRLTEVCPLQVRLPYKPASRSEEETRPGWPLS